MPYTPHNDADVREMLETIGAARINDLWSAIPDRIRLGRTLNLPPALSEAELMKHAQSLARENMEAGRLDCYLGGGTYYHYVPPAIGQVVFRSEFYTAYTPYQPEISQGTLQAIFEFQTMVCELTGMDVANASVYDGAQACAEAALMAERIKPKNKDGAILVAGTVNPRYRDTVRTYLAHSGRPLQDVGYCSSGAVDLDALREAAPGALAFLVQHPNYLGCLEEMEEIASICAETGTLLLVAVSEALSLGLLAPPGDFGADILAAEGQSLGIPMGFGGPHLGLFACKRDYMRKMPGRLVGETTDLEGRTGYVLTLSTREQHIRRAKATSNICTNQGLLALSAAVYMSLIGPGGLCEIAEINRANAEYLKEALAEKGAGMQLFTRPTFNEFVLDLGREPGPVLARMADKGILAGIPLGPRYPELENAILVSVTEMAGKDAMDRYADELKKSLSA